MTSNTLATLAVLSCLAGCATDQRADVDQYRAISAVPGEAPAHTKGQDLTLVGALQLTTARNEQLSIQGERYIQALAERQRLASNLKPTVDLFIISNPRENTAGSGNNFRTDAGIGGQYSLLTGLSDFRTVAAADARIRASRWLILDLREALLLECARAYYETMRAERLVGVLRSSVQVQEERLRDAQARNRAGFTRPLDVAQIEAQVSQTRTNLLVALNQAQTARATLELLTAAPVANSTLTDGFAPPTITSEPEQMLAAALGHRQDVLAARANADEARSLVDAAIGQYAPTITLNLDYFLLRETDPTDLDLAGLISLRLPVFSAGRIAADVRGAWSLFRQRVLEYQLLRRQVRRDLEVALTDHRTSEARVVELRIRVAAANQALQLAEASYNAGLGTNLDRISAQDDVLSADLLAASEEFTYKNTYLAVLRACGMLTSEMTGAAPPAPTAEELEPPESPFLTGGETVPQGEAH